MIYNSPLQRIENAIEELQSACYLTEFDGTEENRAALRSARQAVMDLITPFVEPNRERLIDERYVIHGDRWPGKYMIMDIDAKRIIARINEADDTFMFEMVRQANQASLPTPPSRVQPPAASPALPQPPPQPGDGRILDLVIDDLTTRADAGKLKYGVYLQAHNGRDALVDAYQEALDLAMYLRQKLEEQRTTQESRP